MGRLTPQEREVIRAALVWNEVASLSEEHEQPLSEACEALIAETGPPGLPQTLATTLHRYEKDDADIAPEGVWEKIVSAQQLINSLPELSGITFEQWGKRYNEAVLIVVERDEAIRAEERQKVEAQLTAARNLAEEWIRKGPMPYDPGRLFGEELLAALNDQLGEE